MPKIDIAVTSTSDPAVVAAIIAEEIRAEGSCALRTIGAGALNQATKAIAIARNEHGLPRLACAPEFVNIVIDGEDRTGIRHCLSFGRSGVPTSDILRRDKTKAEILPTPSPHGQKRRKKKRVGGGMSRAHRRRGPKNKDWPEDDPDKRARGFTPPDPPRRSQRKGVDPDWGK